MKKILMLLIVVAALFVTGVHATHGLSSGPLMTEPGMFANPAVTVLTPSNGQQFPQGTAVLVRARVKGLFITGAGADITLPDMSVQHIPLFNVQGRLWEGTFTSTTLVGGYTFLVTATDFGGSHGSDTVNIAISDTTGPSATVPVITPDPTNQDAALTATITDIDSIVAGAEFYVDTDPGTGSGTVMAAQDGSFDTQQEAVTATIPITGLAEGQHTAYVRGMDTASNWGLPQGQTFFVDTVKPQTSDNAPAGWQRSPVTVTLIPADPPPASGVADTLSCVSQSVCTPDNSGVSVLVSAEGTNNVFYYSIDNAGNQEPTKQTQVQIDTTNPSTSSQLSGTQGNNGWWVSGVTVTLSCSDSGSGCFLTQYSLDGSSWTAYSAPFTVTTEGTATVYYNSTDAAGNHESTQSVQFKIDTIPPIATAGTLPAYTGFPVFSLLYSASDSGSGIDYAGLFYSKDSGPWTLYGQFTSSPIFFNSSATGGDGLYGFEIAATDLAGNTEAQLNFPEATTIVDTTGPVASGTAVTPINANSNSTVTATATDALSIIAEAEFYVDADPGAGNGNALAAADGVFDSFTEGLTGTIDISSLPDGQHTAYVRARDAVGNWDSVDSATFTVDTTLPVLTNISPLNKTYTLNDTGDVDYLLSADETLAGANYSIDGGSQASLAYNATSGYWESRSGSHATLTRGQHTITYTAADPAGNSNSTSAAFTIFLQITASTCSDASNKLNGSWDKVTLTQSINNWAGTCITLGADDVIFDGGMSQGVVIDGDKSGIDYGVNLNNKSGATIQDAEIRNFAFGIYDSIMSHNITIDGVHVHRNSDTGIATVGGYNFNISNSVVEWNDIDGITLVNSYGNSVVHNMIKANLGIFGGGDGINFFNNDNSTVKNNNISFNNLYGVQVQYFSTGNAIYNNNFMTNAVQAYDNGANSWDSGSADGGNYWDDYDTPGEGCNDGNGDGFCDGPYNITGGSNQDTYPSLNPW